MTDQPSRPVAHLTLVLTTILHGFTHALGTLLVPLYLLMRDDLRLPGLKSASLVVTVYGLVYCLGSYVAGVLADRYDRKWLLGIGLIGNALAVLAMGLTRQYEMLLVLAVLAGMFGTLFHPAANALVPAHYPNNPGMAIGLLGIGSGLGFFAGPQYAGWRAQSATWEWGLIADWQKPLVEMGLAGIVFGVVFIALAREARGSGASVAKDIGAKDPASPATGNAPAMASVGTSSVEASSSSVNRSSASAGAPAPHADLPNRVAVEAVVLEYSPADDPSTRHTPLPRRVRNMVVALAVTLGCRDFAGVASLTLSSLYLQKAHAMGVKQVGFILGAMMLISVVVNPLSVALSPGRKRLPRLAMVLVIGGLVVATTPHWPVAYVLVVLAAFQTFQLGSYAMSDAAMLERVAPALRGRVVGLFLTLAGTLASMSPFVMGAWVDAMGDSARQPSSYSVPFAVLGALMLLSACSMPLIARLQAAQRAD